MGLMGEDSEMIQITISKMQNFKLGPSIKSKVKKPKLNLKKPPLAKHQKPKYFIEKAKKKHFKSLEKIPNISSI